MIAKLIVTVITVWGLELTAAVALAPAAVLFYRRVISKDAAARNRPRALRWRIKLKLRPGPGYASLLELLVRWSRPAAFFHGRRARPGLTWADRLTCRDHRVRRPARPRAVLPPPVRAARGPGPRPGPPADRQVGRDRATASSTTPARCWPPAPRPTCSPPPGRTGPCSARSTCSTPRASATSPRRCGGTCSAPAGTWSWPAAWRPG